MQKNLIILIILFVVILNSSVISDYIKKQREKSELNSIISKGLAFYSKEANKNLKIDSYFFLREAVKHTGKGHMPYGEEYYENNLFFRILNKEKYDTSIKFSKQENNSYAITPEYKDAKEEYWGSVLLKTLYCDTSGYNEEDFSLLQMLNPGDGSYYDTHFLIALLFLKGNGCYQPDIIEESIKKVSESIIQAQKKDTVFSDLYVERIVVLYWAGYGENIEENWINLIKSNFHAKDSGWRNDPFHYSDSHTTGLALLSLIYYLEGEPEQPFY